MAVSLDFNGGFAVNLQDPVGLYAGEVLVDFSDGYYFYLQRGNGADAPLAFFNSAMDSELRLWGGGFQYDDDSNILVDGAFVDQIEVYSAVDLASNPYLPETWRLVMHFDEPMALADVFDALGAENLAPLHEGGPLIVRGDDLADTLSGGALGDELTGYGGADRLGGRGGADFLYGGADADDLKGGGGADTLGGGIGNDRLTGGAGRDQLLFDAMGGAN